MHAVGRLALHPWIANIQASWVKLGPAGVAAYLQGDLTLSGMTYKSIDSLADSLRQIESAGGMKIRIDCGRVRAADISGMQILDVWMQCQIQGSRA